MQIFSHEFIDSLRRLIGASGISERLDQQALQLHQLAKDNSKIMNNIDKFNEDVAQLKTLVAANTQAIASIADLVKKDEATIADLNAQIVVLKAANPTLDLTVFEDSLATLSANNATVAGIVSAPPVVDLPPAPPAAPPEN